jgi:hypothetical protein
LRAGTGAAHAGRLLELASPSLSPPAPPAWSFALSVGYLARAIFDSSAPGGSSLPLAQGGTLGASLSFPLRRVAVFSSLSLEYHRVTVDSVGCDLPPGVCSAVMLHETFSGGAAYGLFGVSGRPARFLEIGAGLGPGVARNLAESPGSFMPGVWRVAARGLVSVAAVQLPAGLEVTGALTLDRTFGDPYGLSGEQAVHTKSLQIGGLVAVGWRT